MRQRQSSVTTDTQLPVRSKGAASRGVFGVLGAWAAAWATTTNISNGAVRMINPHRSSALRETSIHRFDKHRGGPGTALRAVPRVILERRAGGLHLRERHPLPDQALNPIADNGHHVTVLHDVSFVGNPPMSRNHHRPAFLRVLRNRD